MEAHIREGSSDLLGMNSTIGANELRKLSLLVARHAKIHKDRARTISYTVRKLSELRERGFVESMGMDALHGICHLTAPVWDQLDWQPITADELSREGDSNEVA